MDVKKCVRMLIITNLSLSTIITPIMMIIYFMFIGHFIFIYEVIERC